MNKKQLTTSVIILVILTVITFLTMKKDSRTWQPSNEFNKRKLIENLDVNEVDELIITTDSDKLELKKSEEGQWGVKNRYDYPADFSKLSRFLLKLKELTVVQEPRLLKDQFGSLKLEKPVNQTKNEKAGTLLELKDKDGKIMISMIIGEQHFPIKDVDGFQQPEPDGCYVLLESTEKPLLITDPLKVVDPEPTKWLNKEFIRIPDIISISLKESDEKPIYKIYRKDVKSAWIIEGIREGDIPLPGPMRDVTSAFERIVFDDVSPAKDIDLKGAKTATIETARGIIYNIKLLKKDKKVFAKYAISAKASSPKISKKNLTPEKIKELQQNAIEEMDKLKKTIEKQFYITKWIYEFPSYKIDKVLKDKEDLYKGDL